jgi:hypothetical protein
MKTLAILLLCALSTSLSAQDLSQPNTVLTEVEHTDRGTALHWVTYFEVNTSRFVLEQQQDGAWYTLAIVPASSSTQGRTDYEYEHYLKEPATYRLVLILMDGERMYFEFK